MFLLIFVAERHCVRVLSLLVKILECGAIVSFNIMFSFKCLLFLVFEVEKGFLIMIILY